MSNTPSAPLTGTNVYAQALLLVASIFGGMSGDTAGTIVAAGAGVVAAFFAIRTWIVSAKFKTGKAWISDPNNWSYVTSIVVALLPSAADLIEPLRGLVNALVAGNWTNVITFGLSLLSIVYYTFFKKKPATV